MKNTNLYRKDYNTYQPSMLLDFNLSFDNDVAHDDISRTIIEVVEGINVGKFIDFSNRNSYGYDGVMMFKLVLLAFADLGYVSTRKLEALCKHDVRYMFIAQNQKPSHMAFQRFMNHNLTMPIEDIFFEINTYIEDRVPINTEVLLIDGTKYEANANKNTFVWRKSTVKNREKCWKKTMICLQQVNEYLETENINIRFSIIKEVSIGYLLEVTEVLEKVMKEKGIDFVHGKGCRKQKLQKYYDTIKEYALKIWKYAIHLDILGNRNSFSKTDPDATFMHMKYDYYNHTNVFKPGYNIQIGVSDGYIRNLYVSSDGNDLKPYIPFMNKYYQMYGKYPSKTPADAGYGSYDNYCYCKTHNIELYMKYSGQNKEKEKTTDKNKYQKIHFTKNEDGQYVCPEGHVFNCIKTTIDTRGRYPRINETMETGKCDTCAVKSKCTKSKKGRTIHHCRQLESFHEEVKANLSTPEGIALRIQRSVETEGTFGDLKENHKYDRIRRKGQTNVELEIYIVAIGHNLRKYHRYRMEKNKVSN